MQPSLQITFHNMDPSPFLEACVREHAAKLERFFEHIMACHVVLDAPHRHHHKGKLYTVRIDLTVPAGELAVSHAKPADHAHEDPKVAIRDAFDAIRRELEDHARRRRQDVKTHTAS